MHARIGFNIVIVFSVLLTGEIAQADEMLATVDT